MLFSLPLWAQTSTAAKADPSPTPANYANYAIMLLPPQGKGSGVVLMHDPQNGLEYVEISKIKASMDGGYVPVRLAEIAGLIASLQQQVSDLKTENAGLKSADRQKKPDLLVLQPQPITPSHPSLAEIEAERQARSQELLAQAAAFREERREGAIQTFLLMQNMNRPQPYRLPMPVPMPVTNPSAGRLQTNCTTNRIGNTSFTNCN